MADEGTLKNSDATPPVIPSSGDGASKDDKPIIRSWEINVLGVLLIVFSVLTVYLLYALWPNVDNQKNWSVKSYIFCSNTCKIDCPPDNYCWCIELSAEQRVIVLVLLAGALGSFIHAATSFSNFVGQGKIEKSWIWWYILRPITGMGVSLVFYLVFRGGLLNDTKIEGINIYGVLTLAALSGLFTDRATLKLEEIFQALFKPNDNRAGKLDK